MSNVLGAAVRKLLALAILAVFLFAAVDLVVSPLVARLGAVREDITAKRELLGRFKEAGQTRAAGAGQPEGASDTRPVFLAGDSETSMAAGLQSIVAGAVQTAGVDVRSARDLPVAERDGVRLVGVEVQFKATLAQLQQIVVGLETHRPYLIVDGARLASPGAFDPRAASSDTGLDVSLAVAGAVKRNKS